MDLSQVTMEKDKMDALLASSNGKILDEEDITKCISELSSGGSKHILQAQSPLINFELELMESLASGFNITDFEDTLSVASLMSAEKFEFTHPDDKTPTIAELSQKIKAVPALKNFFIEMVMVADELILNALFEGPQVSLETKDNYTVEYPDFRSNDLIFMEFAEAIGLFVRDPFGTLSMDVLFANLTKFASSGFDPTAISSDNRVGLGLSIALSHFPSLLMSVDPGKTSLVGFLMPKGVRKRILAEAPKSFHIF